MEVSDKFNFREAFSNRDPFGFKRNAQEAETGKRQFIPLDIVLVLRDDRQSIIDIFGTAQLHTRASSGEKVGEDRTSVAVFNLEGEKVGDINIGDSNDQSQILGGELFGDRIEVPEVKLRVIATKLGVMTVHGLSDPLSRNSENMILDFIDKGKLEKRSF